MNSRISVTREDVDRLYGMAFSRNMEKSAQLKETGIGALGGAGLGALLGYLTPRDKDEDKLGRYLRYILGGAAMGGLAGLGYGSSKNLFGDSGTSDGVTDGKGGVTGGFDGNADGDNTPSWFSGRPANIAGGAAAGGATGEAASRLAYLGGRLWDRYLPRTDTVKAVFSNPMKWKSKFVTRNFDRVATALRSGKITADQAKTFMLGLLPGADPSARAASREVAREATKLTQPVASAATVLFRPKLSGRVGEGLETANKALAEAAEASKLGVTVGELAKPGIGRSILRVLGPLVGAGVGALEGTEDQGVRGR